MSLVSRTLSLFKKNIPGGIPVSVADRSWYDVFDWKPGAWQQDTPIHREAVMANWAVFSCITLIARDVGKIRLKLAQSTDGIWTETTSNAFTPVLKKPNRYQTRQQFIENWVTSLESHGNTYVLKERDQRGIVVSMYVLDACRVTPLITPDGDTLYRLGSDYLAGLGDNDVVVPADEIIHDRMNCLYHPLVGLSPIYAAGLAATQALKIQNNSARFFGNMSMPGGVLVSPHEIKAEQAAQYKQAWEQGFGGKNFGRIAVLGGGLEYKGLIQNAVDSQMLETLHATAGMVCSTFHVPAFKIGASDVPRGQKVSDLNQIYYNDCLQSIMHGIENLLDEGLGLDTPKDGIQYGTMFEQDDLLMLDQGSLTTVLKDQVGAGITKIDEARYRLNYEATDGGDTPYLQQQNYSLSALAKRDAGADPFGKASPPAAAPPIAEQPTAAAKAEQELLAKSLEVDAVKSFAKTLVDMLDAEEVLSG